MLLIADAGGTKTDWVVCQSGVEIYKTCTSGINPAVMDYDSIKDVIETELVVSIGRYVSDIIRIEFYGAGCTKEYAKIVERVLGEYFCNSELIVDSDIVGAAKALCGDSLGIAAILGTGSNSCLFDGKEIVQQTPALGYILGDEGGGAVLGRLVLNALLKGRLPKEIVDAFNEEYKLSMVDIIECVYRRPMANKFLASFSTFISKHLDCIEIENLVVENFRSFFRNNIKPYNHPELPVNCVGSIAFYYEKQLRKAAELEGFMVGRILRTPLS